MTDVEQTTAQSSQNNFLVQNYSYDVETDPSLDLERN